MTRPHQEPSPLPVPEAPKPSATQAAGAASRVQTGRPNAAHANAPHANAPHANAQAFAPLLAQYLAVLRRLTELAETEQALLEQGTVPGPMSIALPQQSLSQDYALLSAAIKPKVRLLRDAGLLDVNDLEVRIRRLVTLTKDNQRRLKALKAQANGGVESVMRALSKQADANTRVAAAGPSAPSATPNSPPDPHSDGERRARSLADRITSGEMTPSGNGP